MNMLLSVTRDYSHSLHVIVALERIYVLHPGLSYRPPRVVPTRGQVQLLSLRLSSICSRTGHVRWLRLPDVMLLIWFIPEHIRFITRFWHGISWAWLAYPWACWAYLYIRTYVYFLGSIQVLRWGVRMYFMKWFSKSFVFAHSRFCFAPLQVLVA